MQLRKGLVKFLILPNGGSERRRREIIEYIQILIESSYEIKVFPFGSVPLKTYLPDGDIDLTAVSHYDEEDLLRIFCKVLENAEMNNTEFQVRNVRCIPAKVKLVKCSIDNLPVDIAFNKMAGLCSLNFLEQADQLIGKDNLFKRSVILIKAWCYYESRILGADHGLISTYALEIMTMHIINLFHSTLSSPLVVLYKFLAYYKKFDWESQCVAINGVVLISSLPEVLVQPPEGSDDPLLSAEFLRNCKQIYSFSTRSDQIGQHQFHAKFINIIDPLSDFNNLGRSVNKTNFSRIKFALLYASASLEAISSMPLNKITECIELFFKTTIECNGEGARRDAMPVQEHDANRSEARGTRRENENLLAGIQYDIWSHYYGMYQDYKNPLCLNGEFYRSRGTGTYIPKPIDMESWSSGRGYRRLNYPQFSKPMPADVEPPTTDGDDFNWSAEDENNSFQNLSLVDFPPLPGAKPVEINNVNPASCFLTSWEAGESSLRSTDIGARQTSQQLDCELDPGSPVLKTLPSSNSLLSIQKGKEKEELWEIEVERTIMAKTPPLLENMNETKTAPVLEDMNEFPALPLQCVRGAIDVPDLSLLRLQDLSDFPPLSKKSQKGAAGHKGKNKADKRA